MSNSTKGYLKQRNVSKIYKIEVFWLGSLFIYVFFASIHTEHFIYWALCSKVEHYIKWKQTKQNTKRFSATKR